MTFQDSASAISFSPDGEWLASASEDGSAVLVSMGTGYTRTVVKVDDRLFSIQFVGNGESLVVAGAKAIYVLIAQSGQERYRVETASTITGMAASRDGKYIVSLQSDGMARLWDSQQRRQLAILEHDDSVVSADFSPDGRYVATGSWDKTVKLWLVSDETLLREACTRVEKNLAPDEWTSYLEAEPYRKTCPNLP